MERKNVDTYNYKGWLNSDSFLKRAVAIWAHFWVAHILIVLSLLFIVIALGLILMGIGTIGKALIH